MSCVFQPDIRNIPDHGVPVLCPSCGFTCKRDFLSDAEKQFLIDATLYHELVTEFRFMLAMKAITDRYPGTRHPLLAAKLPKPRAGFTDEEEVSALLDRQPELCDYLRAPRSVWIAAFLLCSRISNVSVQTSTGDWSRARSVTTSI